MAPYELEGSVDLCERKTAGKQGGLGTATRGDLGDFRAGNVWSEPPPPEALVTELVDERVDTLAGFGVRSSTKCGLK